MFLVAVQLVNHVGLQDTSVNQNLPLSGGSLVVDIHGSPCVGNGAVVDGRNLWICNLLPQLTAELRLPQRHAGAWTPPPLPLRSRFCPI